MKRTSILRLEQERAYSRIAINGTVLDVGGDPKSRYHQEIGGTHSITFANYSANYRADIYFDAQELWPVAPQSFDAVILNNLLEHVFDHQTVIHESHKALRPGGRLIGSVPFMYRVHASPDDYWRYTRSALNRLFQETGFSMVRIEELGTGAFAVAYEAVGDAFPPPLLQLGQAVSMGIDRILSRLKPGNAYGPHRFPLGYFFEAIKPTA